MLLRPYFLSHDMQDMIVRLFELPDGAPLRAALAEKGITIRRCHPFEAHILEDWIGKHFSQRWVCESRVAMGHQPSGCFIATKDSAIIGFVCIDATARGFIGPMGVGEAARGAGVGKALMITGLEQMYSLGYAYAIIGGAGPTELYKRWVNATPIENTSMGIYEGILPNP
jgi:GNAT superfamily N-acetyltransferase